MGIVRRIGMRRILVSAAMFLAISIALALIGLGCYRLHLNLASAGFIYLLAIVLVSRLWSFPASALAAIAAALCLANIAPPVYSFRADDPADRIAIAIFFGAAVILARVVSELRRSAAEAVSSVDRRLIDVERRERAWFARELHDDMDRRLAMVSLGLDRLQCNLSGLDAAARGRLQELWQEISRLAADVETLSHQLHASKLQLMGIVGAARSFCKELCERYGVEIEVHAYSVPNTLPQEICLSLFRVLQEALQNAVKHSRSGHFEVSFIGIPNSIELRVRDAGIGFDPATAMKHRGLGLISMQERIKLLHGEFSIASHANRGTTIHAKVPLTTREEAAVTN